MSSFFESVKHEEHYFLKLLFNTYYIHNIQYFRIKANIKKIIASCPAQAGAVDEEYFITSFEDVPTVTLFSAKDLEEQMKIIKDTVGDDKKDWKLRTDSVRFGKMHISSLTKPLTIFPICLFFADEEIKGHYTRRWH